MDTPKSWAETLHALETYIEGQRKSCPACLWFDQAAEVCERDQQRRRPPAKVIAYGCQAYEPDIPF